MTAAALAADRFASLPFDEEWLVSTGLLADAASVLGEVEHAAVLHELLARIGARTWLARTERDAARLLAG